MSIEKNFKKVNHEAVKRGKVRDFILNHQNKKALREFLEKNVSMSSVSDISSMNMNVNGIMSNSNILFGQNLSRSNRSNSLNIRAQGSNGS